jgi:hypothetical protein
MAPDEPHSDRRGIRVAARIARIYRRSGGSGRIRRTRQTGLLPKLCDAREKRGLTILGEFQLAELAALLAVVQDREELVVRAQRADFGSAPWFTNASAIRSSGGTAIRSARYPSIPSTG